MGLLLVVVLAPIVFTLIGVYAVAKICILTIRTLFAPVLFLRRR